MAKIKNTKTSTKLNAKSETDKTNKKTELNNSDKKTGMTSVKCNLPNIRNCNKIVTKDKETFDANYIADNLMYSICSMDDTIVKLIDIVVSNMILLETDGICYSSILASICNNQLNAIGMGNKYCVMAGIELNEYIFNVSVYEYNDDGVDVYTDEAVVTIYLTNLVNPIITIEDTYCYLVAEVPLYKDLVYYMESGKFSNEQLREISIGILQGVPVHKYAIETLDYVKMKLARIALNNNAFNKINLDSSVSEIIDKLVDNDVHVVLPNNETHKLYDNENVE